MNYLASPPLVVAYALAGTMDRDLREEPLGEGSDGNPVFLRDIWPTSEEIADIVGSVIETEMYTRRVLGGARRRRTLAGAPRAHRGAIHVGRLVDVHPQAAVPGRHRPGPGAADRHRWRARVLALLGDSVTTDHISPAGVIRRDGPAGRVAARARRTDRGVQLLRRAAREPRSDDARHVRQHAAAQPARARNRRRLHRPSSRTARR